MNRMITGIMLPTDTLIVVVFVLLPFSALPVLVVLAATCTSVKHLLVYTQYCNVYLVGWRWKTSIPFQTTENRVQMRIICTVVRHRCSAKMQPNWRINSFWTITAETILHLTGTEAPLELKKYSKIVTTVMRAFLQCMYMYTGPEL